MKFTYFRKTGELYRDVNGGREWDGDEGYEFDYEPESEQVESALTDVIFDDYFGNVSADKETLNQIRLKLNKLIFDIELDEELCKVFYDELKNYFEDEAQESEHGD